MTPDAFTEAYQDHSLRITRYFQHKVGGYDTAEDDTAEVFLRLWRSYREEGKLPQWLSVCARRVMLDRARKDTAYGQVRFTADAADVLHVMSDPRAAAAYTVVLERAQLADLLSAVTLLQRRVLLLGAIGHSDGEIADSLGVTSPNAVRQLKCRAIRSIRRIQERLTA